MTKPLVGTPKRIRKSRKTIAKERAENGLVTRTLHCRIKDKHAPWLLSLASEVNFVWNYDNDLSYQILKKESRFISAFDLNTFTTGATKAGLKLHSQTVQAINEQFIEKRQAAKKAKLRWRVSNRKRSNYSLGWIPFKKVAITYRNGQVHFMGKALSLWDSYGLADYQLGAGSISEDARGRWYFNVTVTVKKQAPSEGAASVGIDLGLKEFATFSDGKKEEARQFYRKSEAKLATAQRANKKNQVKALHAKIGNCRKDVHHKLSTKLVRQHGAIFVGNVNSSGLSKTNMAKSVLDAGWTAFRTMLKYKCDSAGVWFEEVNESYSTVICSACDARSGPSGLKDLRIREWTCTECGVHHDRDVNAARLILRRGLATLAGGIPVLTRASELPSG